MPDWVTHLGTTYIAADTAGRFSPRLIQFLEMRHVLLGALLPDATRFAVILVDILDWPAVSTFTYLIPFHSLLIVGLLSGAIALLIPAANRSSGKAYGLIMLGAVVHFLLDDFEGVVGCGSTTFYPFYFGKPINGWDGEGNFATVLLVISAIAIGVALSRRAGWSPLTLRFTWWRLFGAAILFLVAVVLPLFFRQWMIERNAYYLGLVVNPEAYEGQSVELCFSEVIAGQPPTIEEFDTPFVLQTSSSLTQGEWVSVRGVYHQGLIKPVALIRHRGFSDVGLSAIAAIALGLLLIDGQQVKGVLVGLKERIM